MTIGWRQFNDVTSNFRQGGWGYTTDAGITWTFPGILENNVFRSDPVTKFDELGNFFYLSLQSNVQRSFFCDDLWSSVNGGQILDAAIWRARRRRRRQAMVYYRQDQQSGPRIPVSA